MSKKEEFLELLNEDKEADAKTFFFSHLDEIYKEDPFFALDSCVVLRLENEEYGECYEDLAWFSDKPYISIAFEEKLMNIRKTLKDKIHQVEERKKKAKDSLLDEKNEKALLSILLSFSKEEKKAHEEELKHLVEKEEGDISLFCLLALLDIHAQGTLNFPRHGKIYLLDLESIVPPLMDESQKMVEDSLKELAPSPSYFQMALEALRAAAVFSYPELPYKRKEMLFAYSACIYVSRLLEDATEESLLIQKDLFSKEEIEKCIFFIKDTAFSSPSR